MCEEEGIATFKVKTAQGCILKPASASRICGGVDLDMECERRRAVKGDSHVLGMNK